MFKWHENQEAGFRMNAKRHFKVGMQQNRTPDWIHASLPPPHVLANQRCPCPLGAAAANDFRCTADPSTFLPFKALANSPSPCTRGAKQGSQRSQFTRTTFRAGLTGRARESIDANRWETSTHTQKTIQEAHAKLSAMLADPCNYIARSLEVSSNVSDACCGVHKKKRPLEKIKELIMFLRQVHSVAEPSWHN